MAFKIPAIFFEYGTAVGDDDYGPDSLQTVFSSGKNLEALAVAHLVDRGLLDYDDPVIRYCPFDSP